MQQKQLFIVCSLAVLAGLSSCGTERNIYKSSKPNIPFFNEKGDAEASASVGFSGADVQDAYAFTDHFAVTGAASLGLGETDEERKSINDKIATVDYNRSDFELGIGYFLPLNPRKTITFNLFAGVGTGNFKINESEDSSSYKRNYKVNTFRWYLQPSINFMPGDYFRFALYFKPTFVQYGNVNSNYSAHEKEYFGYDYIHNQTVLYPEFGYDAQLKVPGLSWLYLENTLSITPWPDDLINETRLHNESVNFTVGLSVHLNKIGK